MVVLIYRHSVCTFSKGLMYRVKCWNSVLPINDEDSSRKHLNGRRCRRKTMFLFTWSVLRFCFCFHNMLSFRVVERKHPCNHKISENLISVLTSFIAWFFRTFSPIIMLRMHIVHGNQFIEWDVQSSRCKSFDWTCWQNEPGFIVCLWRSSWAGKRFDHNLEREQRNLPSCSESEFFISTMSLFFMCFQRLYFCLFFCVHINMSIHYSTEHR